MGGGLCLPTTAPPAAQPSLASQPASTSQTEAAAAPPQTPAAPAKDPASTPTTSLAAPTFAPAAKVMRPVRTQTSAVCAAATEIRTVCCCLPCSHMFWDAFSAAHCLGARMSALTASGPESQPAVLRRIFAK